MEKSSELASERGFTTTRQKVYNYITQYYQQYGCRPSLTEIANMLNLSRQRISQIVQWLTDNKKICKVGAKWTRSKLPLIKN